MDGENVRFIRHLGGDIFGIGEGLLGIIFGRLIRHWRELVGIFGGHFYSAFEEGLHGI